MFRHKIESLLIASAVLIATTSVVEADLVLNFSPSSTGGTVLEIIGTGQVLNDGNFAFGYDGNALIVDPSVTQSKSTDPTSTGIVLDGQVSNSLVINAFNNPSFSLVEITFTDSIGIGAQLSDLNGVYTFDESDFSFDGFNPGQYQLNYSYGTDIGLLTVNVSAVPEPSGFLLIGFAFVASAIQRRKRS